MIVISGLTTAVTSGEKTRPAKNGFRMITESKAHMSATRDAAEGMDHTEIIKLHVG